MIRRPPRSTLSSSSAASDVYKRQVVGVADVGWQVVPGLSLLLGGADEVLDVVEVDAGQVRPPGGHGLLGEQPQPLEPGLEHPLRLAPVSYTHLRAHATP